MNAAFTLGELNADGTRPMTVNGRVFIVSAQSLPNDLWAVKLQLKANLFATEQ